MDRIVVLMSTYNGEKYIRQQIDSILNQKGCTVELYVRDDGSTDTTLQILAEYKMKNQLEWYSGENLGAAKSFYDLLLRASECAYYAFADQDDIWDDDKLYIAIEALKSYNRQPAIYYANARITDEHGQEVGINTYKVEQNTNFKGFVCSGGALGCTMILNGKLRELAKNGGIPDRIIMHDDYLTSLAFSINGKVIYDHVPHMSYRQHTNNVIGIPMNLKQAIQSRYKAFVAPVKISIAEQSFDMLKRFADVIPNENQKFLKKVADYRKSFSSRAYLAFHFKTKYVSWKSSAYIRLGLLCGKR